MVVAGEAFFPAPPHQGQVKSIAQMLYYTEVGFKHSKVMVRPSKASSGDTSQSEIIVRVRGFNLLRSEEPMELLESVAES